MNESARLVAAQAIGPTLVRLAFDQDVALGEHAAATIVPLHHPGVTAIPRHVTSTGNQGLVYLHGSLTPSIPYAITIPGLGQVHFYGFCPNWPEDRSFDLWGMLPKWNRAIDSSGDLARFVACLQEVTDYLLAGIDVFTEIIDLERAPEQYLDLVLMDLGNPFPFELDELDKRRLATVLVDLYRLKGTALGIRNAIRFFLGIEVEDIAVYNGERLTLGESELGVDWVVGPSDRFSLYAFEIRVGRKLSGQERERMMTIVKYLQPVGAHFMGIVEPEDPAVWDHWELGISELGSKTILHGAVN